MPQPQTIGTPKILKDFFACRVVLAADHRYPETIQRLFRLQNCLSRRSSIPRKHSKTFSLAELSQPQIIDTPKMIEELFTCRSVLAADLRYPENIQRLFRLQNRLSRRSSIPRNYSLTFSPLELSQPQIINNLETFKNFFSRRFVLAANQRYPEIIQRLLHRQKTLSHKSSTTWKHSKTLSPAECLGRKSSISQNYSKTFSPAESSQPQIIDTPKLFKDFFTCRILLAANDQQPGKIQRLFQTQICLSRKSSTTWKHSKTFPPAELSQPQINDTLKLFKDFFTGRKLLVTNHQQHRNIQRLYRLQNVLDANHQYLKAIQRLFRLQNCLRRRSSIPRKHSKTFSPAELSQPQIIDTPKTFKDFFACRIVSAADHRYPESIQRLFHLHNCLSSKSSTTWKHSKTFSPAELSQPQIVDTPKTFRDFFACRNVLAADQRYPEFIQRLCHRQKSLNLKSSTTWKHSKTFSPAQLSWTQIISIPNFFKDFFACRFVLAADQRYPESIQRLFQLLKSLSLKSSTTWKH